ncbi:NAD(P)H-dependent oxidoreductase [Candidatus Uhrbacteria bacterium]|nr:NAD(P)H-dependent oxidoreductase [Candidatus Uhrbacteria bacterium]
MSQLNVIAMSGSLRKDSYNRKALQIAKKIATDAGAEVTEFDLRELNLPMYDGDVEAQGFPKSVQKLRRAAESANVFLFATPEYNASTSGALKNAIDWLSRAPKMLPGKVAAVFGATTGMSGTVRGQMHLREILADTGLILLPKPVVLIRSASAAFTEDGQFTDQKTHALLKELIEKTLTVAKKL